MQNTHWKRLARKQVYADPRLEVFIDTVKLPDGTVIDDYTVTTLLDVVMLVATDKQNNLLTLREYKYPLDKTILTLPAGTMTMHSTADPLAEAMRELKEETGYTSTDAELVATLNSHTTKNTHKLYIIRAKDVIKTHGVQHEATEFIDIELMHLGEVKQSIAAGEWTSAETLAALAICGLA